MVITNMILRTFVILIELVGLALWIRYSRTRPEHMKLSILPMMTMAHMLVFSFFALLNRTNIIDLAPIITTWSQILRIHEAITLSLGAIVMLMVNKYERRD